MDLGLKGRKAIVSAASKGLGKACAMALAREGVAVTMIARTADALEAAAHEIADRGNEQRLASFRCNKWGECKGARPCESN